MGIMFRRVAACLLLVALIWTGSVLSDKQKLKESVIRMHVVANSDSDEDQKIKYMVRDAVTESLKKDLCAVADISQAKNYLRENLPKIQQIAEKTLCRLGCQDNVTVSLCREAFEKRIYDTFSLPAGIYEALRITIGEGEGKNWWCVVYPSLCLPQSGQTLQNVAAGAGFSDSLLGSITHEKGFEIRFAALDVLGKLENIFFGG